MEIKANIFLSKPPVFCFTERPKNPKLNKNNQIESCLVQFDRSLFCRSSLGDANEALSEGFLGLSLLLKALGSVAGVIVVCKQFFDRSHMSQQTQNGSGLSCNSLGGCSYMLVVFRSPQLSCQHGEFIYFIPKVISCSLPTYKPAKTISSD